jgi:hypothetical protein
MWDTGKDRGSGIRRNGGTDDWIYKGIDGVIRSCRIGEGGEGDRERDRGGEWGKIEGEKVR